MNTGEWIVVITAIAGVLIQILIGVYVYGRLSQKVEAHDEQIESIEKDQTSQWNHIGTLREDMGRVKGHLRLNGINH